ATPANPPTRNPTVPATNATPPSPPVANDTAPLPAGREGRGDYRLVMPAGQVQRAVRHSDLNVRGSRAKIGVSNTWRVVGVQSDSGSSPHCRRESLIAR